MEVRVPRIWSSGVCFRSRWVVLSLPCPRWWCRSYWWRTWEVCLPTRYWEIGLDFASYLFRWFSYRLGCLVARWFEVLGGPWGASSLVFRRGDGWPPSSARTFSVSTVCWCFQHTTLWGNQKIYLLVGKGNDFKLQEAPFVGDENDRDILARTGL
jgi:hypothetical protein